MTSFEDLEKRNEEIKKRAKQVQGSLRKGKLDKKIKDKFLDLVHAQEEYIDDVISFNNRRVPRIDELCNQIKTYIQTIRRHFGDHERMHFNDIIKMLDGDGSEKVLTRMHEAFEALDGELQTHGQELGIAEEQSMREWEDISQLLEAIIKHINHLLSDGKFNNFVGKDDRLEIQDIHNQIQNRARKVIKDPKKEIKQKVLALTEVIYKHGVAMSRFRNNPEFRYKARGLVAFLEGMAHILNKRMETVLEREIHGKYEQAIELMMKHARPRALGTGSSLPNFYDGFVNNYRSNTAPSSENLRQFQEYLMDLEEDMDRIKKLLKEIMGIFGRFDKIISRIPTDNDIDDAHRAAEELLRYELPGANVELPEERRQRDSETVREVIRGVGTLGVESGSENVGRAAERVVEELQFEIDKPGEAVPEEKIQGAVEGTEQLEQGIQAPPIKEKIGPERTEKLRRLFDTWKRYQLQSRKNTTDLVQVLNQIAEELKINLQYKRVSRGRRYLGELVKIMNRHKRGDISKLAEQCDYDIRKLNDTKRLAWLQREEFLRKVLAGRHTAWGKDPKLIENMRALDSGLYGIFRKLKEYIEDNFEKDPKFGNRAKQLVDRLHIEAHWVQATMRHYPNLAWYYKEIGERPRNANLLTQLYNYLMRGWRIPDRMGPGPITIIRDVVQFFGEMEKAGAIPEKGKPVPPKVKEDVPRQLDEMERFIDAELREAKMQGFSEKGYSTGSFVYDLVHQKVKRVTFIPHLAQAWAGISRAYNQVELETTMRGVEFEGEYKDKLKRLRKNYKEAEEIYKRQKDKLENYDKWIEKVKEMWRNQGDPNLEDKGKIEEAIKGEKEFKMIRNFMKDIAALIRKFRSLKKSIIELEEIWFK